MQPVGGMDKIVSGFEHASIPEGRQVKDLVQTNKPVQSIWVKGKTALVITENGEYFAADYVIATLAAPLLAKLDGNFLDVENKKTLSVVSMDAACKVAWQSKYRFWEQENRIYGGISWTKDIISQVWYPSFGFNSAIGVLVGAYNEASAAEEFQTFSRSKRLEVALNGAEKLHPGFQEKVFSKNGVSIAWAKMPYQAGGWANGTSFTQRDIFKKLIKIDIQDNPVLLAGDWFSYWPGWQEGALDSAHYVTDQIHQFVAYSK